MHIVDALYRAAHNYPHGGIDALASRLGISANSLQHKVNPTYPGAHCSPGEMAQIMELTGDHSALQALAARLGYVLLQFPQGGTEAGFSRELASTVQQFGEFIAEVSQDLVDGLVTTTELRRIEKEGADALHAMQSLMALAAQMHESAKPVSLRTVKAAS